MWRGSAGLVWISVDSASLPSAHFLVRMFFRFSTFRTRPARGFTLVEMMVVVVIVGLLAAIAIPTFVRLQRNAQDARFISDLRTFSEAFEAFAMKNGRWPANAGSGVVPAGMSGEFRDADWTGMNSLGGRWNWDYRYAGVTAGISTVGVKVDDGQMTAIDARIDDGNLGTGQFIKTGNRYTYILQK